MPMFYNLSLIDVGLTADRKPGNGQLRPYFRIQTSRGTAA